jgi:hypothetical protein
MTNPQFWALSAQFWFAAGWLTSDFWRRTLCVGMALFDLHASLNGWDGP